MELAKFILLQYAFYIIACKYDLKENLQGWGNLLSLGKRKATQLLGAFLYKVSECEFCTIHHVGVAVFLVFVPLYGFRVETVFYPLMGSSAIILLKRV